MINYKDNKEKTKKGRIIILSSPSGGGKTSIAKELISRNPNMVISISVTTRNKNNSEIDGQDYFFIKKEEFFKYIKEDKFLEYTEIYGNFYGTLKKNAYDIIENGQTIIFDIDWHGHRSIRKKISDIEILSFFIIPPSIDVLTERLKKRNRESEIIINERLRKAYSEMQHKSEYDYIIVNDTIKNAVEKIENMIQF